MNEKLSEKKRDLNFRKIMDKRTSFSRNVKISENKSVEPLTKQYFTKEPNK